MKRQHRISPALFSHAEIALREVLRFAYPADSVLSRYFRQHHELGHGDRGFIAETVFAVLRRMRSLEFRCGPRASARQLLLMALIVERGWARESLTTTLKSDEAEWLTAGALIESREMPVAVALDLPDWLHDALCHQFDADQVTGIADGLNQAAPLDLRINPLKTSREAVLAHFSSERLEVFPGAYSPLALRLPEKPALARHPLFLDGSVEVQDEGSQLLGYLVAPRRGEMVVDFCAGAGGKTLLLGALMHNSGRLYAFDVSEKRLSKLKPRLARSGLSNVYPVRIEHERDTRVKRLAGKVDRVLVDAPCSGLGTIRRNPDHKWRQSPASIATLQNEQLAILESAARLLKVGGRLVYATCSLLTAENDDVVDKFLSSNANFGELSAGDVLGRQGISVTGERLRLFPNTHQTDAFFAAVMERRS